MRYIKGLILSIIVTIIAIILSNTISLSTATLAIILGAIISNSFNFINKKENGFLDGIKFAEKDLLMIAIALMGINLNFTILASLGYKTILLIISGMIFTIFAGIYLGKIFGLNNKLALMIGIGNGVCGSSAIAATAPIVRVKTSDIGISIALVNLMGTIGIFLAPFIAYLIGFDDKNAGIFVGNTLQAVGQVVAAGLSISNDAGVMATIVKMGRILLLIPIVFILIYYMHKKDNLNETKPKVSFPKFILWFLFFVSLASFEILPKNIENFISSTAHYISLVAMSAIGLMIHFETIKNNAKDAFKVSSILFAMQLIFSGGLLLLF